VFLQKRARGVFLKGRFRGVFLRGQNMRIVLTREDERIEYLTRWESMCVLCISHGRVDG